MNWQERIVSNPDVLLGKPTIWGTRISVELLLELFENGWTREQILESYPRLSVTDIAAVYPLIDE